MLRTIFTIGLFAVLGLLALKLAFGLFIPLLGLLMVLVVMAIKVAVVGLVIYVVLRLVSPDTARRLRDRFDSRP